MTKTDINKIYDLIYFDSETGEIKEKIKMREIFSWNGKRYELIRHYELDKENILNPFFSNK
jgi:hypothetical protein